MELEVVHDGQSEDRSNRLELCDWGERLVVVDACLMGEASSDQSSLVPVDRTMRKAFDLEHPLLVAT
jgi:7,8-dihydro-6-hydroxymethylpterin-pyrophosphokinase